MTDRPLLQQWLDTLEPLSAYGRVGTRDVDQAALQQVCTALRSALAQSEAEPVATVLDGGDCFRLAAYLPPGTKLYAAPQAQPDPWRMAVDAAMVAHVLDCTTPDSDPKQCVELLCKQVADIWRDIAAPAVPAVIHFCRRHDFAIVPDPVVGCEQCNAESAAPAAPLTDDMVEAEFVSRGDDKGQGLHPYWKDAFREGFNFARSQLSAVPAAPNLAHKPAVQRLMDLARRFRSTPGDLYDGAYKDLERACYEALSAAPAVQPLTDEQIGKMSYFCANASGVRIDQFKFAREVIAKFCEVNGITQGGGK